MKSQNDAPLGLRVLAQGWFWAGIVVPLAYFGLVRQAGMLDRDGFLLATIVSGVAGLVVLLLWKLMSRGEIWFQIGSFMFNVLFVGYFISLATR